MAANRLPSPTLRESYSNPVTNTFRRLSGTAVVTPAASMSRSSETAVIVVSNVLTVRTSAALFLPRERPHRAQAIALEPNRGREYRPSCRAQLTGSPPPLMSCHENPERADHPSQQSSRCPSDRPRDRKRQIPAARQPRSDH